MLAVLFICFVSTAMAQTPAGGNGNGNKMQEMMRERLKDSVGLANDKIDSVMAIKAQFQPQMREVFMNQQLTQDEKTAKLNDIKTLIHARYKNAGLTDEQITKIEEMDQRMRDRMMNKMKNGTPKQ